MSGIYDSTVVLDRRATMLVECRTQASRVLAAIEALSEAVTRALVEVGGQSLATSEMNAAKADVIRSLEGQRVWAEKTRTSLLRTVVPESYAQTTVQQLSALQAELLEIESGVTESSVTVRSALSDFDRAAGADESLVAARAGLLELMQQLNSASAVLHEWMPERQKRLANALSAAQAAIAHLAQQGDGGAIAESAQELADQTSKLRVDVAHALSAAHERRALHERRDYLARSLISVCMDLGFVQMDVAAISGDDEVALRFDTLDRGIIDFRIGLDGRIHTDSAIDEAHCAEQFDAVSEALSHEYGLDARFTALQEIDERPHSQASEAAAEPIHRRRSVFPHEG